MDIPFISVLTTLYFREKLDCYFWKTVLLWLQGCIFETFLVYISAITLDSITSLLYLDRLVESPYTTYTTYHQDGSQAKDYH